MATPHTRGSTLTPEQRYRFLHGYPAYAGIDRTLRLFLRRSFRLPRIRGDRPLPLYIRRDGNEATPHTRGSTIKTPA